MFKLGTVEMSSGVVPANANVTDITYDDNTPLSTVDFDALFSTETVRFPAAGSKSYHCML